MKTIAICNLKGGVGKTVTAANLAAVLAGDHHKRVLLIDADGQGNLSQFYGVTDHENTTLDLLQNGTGYYPDFVTPTKLSDIDIIPADMSLMYADVDAIKDGRANLSAIADLRDAIEADKEDGYDFLIIDCPPAFTAASTAALAGADSVIIPIKLDAFSTAGMAELVAQIKNMKRINERISLAGVLVTMWGGSPEEKAALQFLTDKMPVFRTKIRSSPRVGASTFAREPLRTYSPRSSASRDYRALVTELTGGKTNA